MRLDSAAALQTSVCGVTSCVGEGAAHHTLAASQRDPPSLQHQRSQNSSKSRHLNTGGSNMAASQKMSGNEHELNLLQLCVWINTSEGNDVKCKHAVFPVSHKNKQKKKTVSFSL